MWVAWVSGRVGAQVSFWRGWRGFHGWCGFLKFWRCSKKWHGSKFCYGWRTHAPMLPTQPTLFSRLIYWWWANPKKMYDVWRILKLLWHILKLLWCLTYIKVTATTELNIFHEKNIFPENNSKKHLYFRLTLLAH